MTEETLPKDAPETAETTEVAGEGSGRSDEPGEGAAPVDWKARADELFAALARSQADFENYRRRARQEREDAAKYGVENLLRALLPVIDNLERALAAMPSVVDGSTGGGSSASSDTLRQGVELTLRQFHEVLRREGVTAIEAVGQPFDPRVHEAVMQEESAAHPESTVLAEFQKGYRLHDRVLRPSMVKVSKRGGED